MTPPPFYHKNDEGELQLNLHQGQLAAWNSTARFVVVTAGSQSGKTAFGPWWLWREICQRGPGDYLVATPSFPLLNLKALPEFKRLFQRHLKLGRYTGSPSRKFEFSKEGQIRCFGEDTGIDTNVWFGHAQDPESLESATAKAAWLDEAGQKKFKLGSFEAILRRLSIAQGRVLITTTPYNLGWLKQVLVDPWAAAHTKGETHPEIQVIRFDSTTNPAFPQAEFSRRHD